MEATFGILWSLSLMGVCMAGKYCYTSGGEVSYCAYGCCGRYYQHYCCSMYSWVIVLIVLGVLLICAGVAICTVCWKKKKQGRQTVGTTGNYTTVTYVNQAPLQPQPMFYGHPPPPRPPPPSYHHVTSGQHDTSGYHHYHGHQPAYPPLGPGRTAFNPAYPPPPPPKY